MDVEADMTDEMKFIVLFRVSWECLFYEDMYP